VEVFAYILLLLLAATVIQSLYYVFLGYKIHKLPEKKETSVFPPVSVVICAKNEAKSLEKNLPLILGQNYPDFEVLVVDDGSVDETRNTLEQLMNQYSQLKQLYISAADKIGVGKKYALQKGVQNAAREIILVTDADCAPATPIWIQKMVAALQDKKIVLGISPYLPEPGFLNALIEYETSLTAMQYIRYANAGIPYMGVGRNLCFQKDIFLQKKWTPAEMQLPSGDDDLFIQSMANNNNTTTCTDPLSFTYSKAPETWKDWYVQKKRHLATGFQYSLKHQFLLALFLISKLLVYLAFFILLITGRNILLAGGLLLCYWQILIAVNYNLNYSSRLNKRWYGSAIFDMAYVFSIIFTGIAGNIAPQKTWK
jgi:poly-beta-1,6-N-acetyl-D-glucosamine synthase